MRGKKERLAYQKTVYIADRRIDLYKVLNGPYVAYEYGDFLMSGDSLDEIIKEIEREG
ncbi:MAG: hypothetical protein VB085_08885 [Peptococcaceae bacterium]|nr:hypothetical protein [Peptococcaceae bacterium]